MPAAEPHQATPANRPAALQGQHIKEQKRLPLKPLYAWAALSVLRKPRRLPPGLQKLPRLSVEVGPLTPALEQLLTFQELSQTSTRHTADESSVPLLFPVTESFGLALAAMCLPGFPVSVLGGVLAAYKGRLHRRVLIHEQLVYRCGIHNSSE